MYFIFFFNDTATTEIYTLSLHDALPISINVLTLPRSPFLPCLPTFPGPPAIPGAPFGPAYPLGPGL